MNLKKQIRKEITIDHLIVVIYVQPEVMAYNASDFVEKNIKEAINKSGFANIILATGSSQFLFLEHEIRQIMSVMFSERRIITKVSSQVNGSVLQYFKANYFTVAI